MRLVLSWQAATTLHTMLDHLFFAMILAQIQPLKDVAVPRLQVHGKGPFTLAAPLINVPDEKSTLCCNEHVKATCLGLLCIPCQVSNIRLWLLADEGKSRSL